MDQYVNIYKELVPIPEVKNATISNVSDGKSPNVSVQVTWSSRNISKLEHTLSVSNYLLHGNDVTALPSAPLDKVCLTSHNENDGRTAYVVDNDTHQYLMILNPDGLNTTINLKAEEVHGKVYSDPEFASLVWSPDGNKLIYVAEKKRVKPTNFFVSPKKESGEDGRGEEHVYYDDWGEQLTGQYQSVVVIVDLVSGSVQVHNPQYNLCPGQLVWTPDGLGIVGTAVDGSPFKLGLIYCRMRESVLFHLDMDGNYTELVKRGNYVQAPRFSPDGTKLVFMKSPVGGTHIWGATISLLTWPEKKESTIVHYVNREKSLANDDKFWGLYGSNRLSRRCWSADSKYVIFSSIGPCKVVLYAVNVESSKISLIGQNDFGSTRLLDIYKDWIVVEQSSFTEPSKISIGLFSTSDSPHFVKLSSLPGINGIELDWMDQWHITSPTPHPIPTYSDISIPMMYIGPTKLPIGASKRPLICWPHGGPHSAFANAFSMNIAFFVQLGYSILLPNYRGSLGMGTDSIDSLPGHCGTTDVDDVYQSTLSCLDRYEHVIDASKVVLFGGSHGGFLVTHLSAKHPELYKVVSARNAVIDLPSMASVTDIPDWTFIECGKEYNHQSIPGSDHLVSMYNASPISRIDSVKAPTLLLIGKNDRRVPPSQSINYHKKLLARGVPTKLLVYDDCHPLSKVDVDADAIIHTAIWFNQHLSTV